MSKWPTPNQNSSNSHGGNGGGRDGEAAIQASGLLELFPEIALTELKVGIFGVAGKLDQLVREGDRIEIYRPLVHDPKEARRQRALKGF